MLKNQNEGYSWHLSADAPEAHDGQGFVKAAYSYGEAKNTVDPGSIAFGSWNNNQHPGDPNNPGVGYLEPSPGHRVFVAGSYRFDWFKLRRDHASRSSGRASTAATPATPSRATSTATAAPATT